MALIAAAAYKYTFANLEATRRPIVRVGRLPPLSSSLPCQTTQAYGSGID